MTTFQDIIAYIVPAIVVPFATELVKKFFKVEIPLVKLVIVAALTFGASWLLSLLYAPGMPIADIAKISMAASFLAVFGKELMNSLPKKNGASLPPTQ